jgi:ComF family protein
MYFGLCQKCRDFFIVAATGEARCEICGKPLITERDICLSCREKTLPSGRKYNDFLEKLWTFFPYTGLFKTVLGSYKFKRSLGIGNFLACFPGFVLADLDPAIIKEAAWVPVPPRHGKIKKQGWDQVEFLAALLGKEYKRSGGRSRCLPVIRCLKRLPSRSQKELNREERETNLKGRILCKKKPPKTAILFDDVVTTGATLNACASALLESGTERVYGVCLFYD